MERRVDLEQLARDYAAIVGREPGPWMLCGYSFGGMVAYEVGRMLGPDCHVVLLDAGPRAALSAHDPAAVPQMLEQLEHEIVRDLRNISNSVDQLDDSRN